MSMDLVEQLQKHRSYEQFQTFEEEQRTQEEIRRQFKAPLGRDPPLRMSLPVPAWKSTRVLLSPRPPTHRAQLSARLPKLQFSRDSWESMKTACKDENRTISQRVSLPTSYTPVQLPSYNTEVAVPFQYALPVSTDFRNFNPFLRPYAHNHFFPLAFFFLDETDYSRMEFPEQAVSRWRRYDESWEWRKCTVVAYDPQERLFTIRWSNSNSEKRVSRVNLRLGAESEDSFLCRLHEATQRRDLEEAILRCQTRAEASLSSFPPIVLSAATQARILSGLRRYLTAESEGVILGEVEDYYRRSVVNFIFEVEHFFAKWQLTVQPWTDEQTQRRAYDQRSQICTFDRPKAGKVLSALLECRLRQHRLVQSFLRRITAIRQIDIFGFLTPGSIARSTRRLQRLYREHWMGQIKAITGLSVETTNEVCDHFKDSPLLPQACSLYFPLRLNAALKSQVEFALVSSLSKLAAEIERRYAVLPLPWTFSALFQVISGEVLEKRRKERWEMLLPEDREFAYEGKFVVVAESEYGMRLTRTLIAELKAYFASSKLHSAFVFTGPKALFTFYLVPAHSTAFTPPTIKGVPDTEDFLPRHLRESKKPISTPVLQATRRLNCFLSIISTVEECTDAPEGSEPDSPTDIMANENLGWTSVGRDNRNLQLEPSISEFQEQLKTLFDLPLRTLAECPTIAPVDSRAISLHFYRKTYTKVLRKAQTVARYSLYGPLAMVAILRQYEYLVQDSQQSLLNSIISSHLGDYSGLSEELETLAMDIRTITHNLPETLQFGLVELNLVRYKEAARENGERLLRCLLEELQWEYSGLLTQAGQLFQTLMDDLHRYPQTVEELQGISDYLKKGQDAEKFREISLILQQAKTIKTTLQTYNKALNEKQLEKTWETQVWQTEIRMSRSRTQIRINKARPGFIEQVADQGSSLLRTLVDSEQAIKTFETYSDLETTDEHAQTAASLVQTLVQSQEEAVQINFREKVLGMPETDFSDFPLLHKAFQKHYELWSFSRDWLHASEEWYYNNFRQVNSEVVGAKYSEGEKLLLRLQREFEGKEALAVVEELQKQMKDFQQYVLLIMQLRHPALRDRHWDSILTLLSSGLKLESLTLHTLVKANILQHLPAIHKICYEALNEFEIERVLGRVESEGNNFTVAITYDPIFQKLPRLEGLDEAEAVMNEHLATISYIQAASRYSNVFRSRIEKTKASLISSCTVLRDLKELQSAWLSLYPLLQLEEIKADLASDESRIEELQDFFVHQTELIQSSLSLAVFTDTKIKSHVEASEWIEVLTKEVEKVIKRKTSVFARLMFFSPGELKMFLSSVARRGTVAVSALYPGIGSLSLNSPNIQEVSRGEFKLLLRKPVPLQVLNKSVPVEGWLQELDYSLRSTFQYILKDLVQRALQEADWWQSSQDPQVLCIVQQIRFSQAIFAALELETAVATELPKLKSLLAALIGEIRPIFGTPGQSSLVMFRGEGAEASKAASRAKLEKLVLLLLQQLHILHSAGENRHFDWDDLLWRAVVRHQAELDSRVLDLKVTYFDMTIGFGFEWLPLPLPLFVSTPVTERCMLNLACALKYHTPGLLQGGPGCSKSETLKEMALMYGRLVLSLTLAQGVQSGFLISALIGCLATGTWLVCEEVDKLEPVLANALVHFLPKIGEAQKEGKHEMVLDGESMQIHEGFAFWAMTTQSEIHIPIRVRECFRCVALVQPDLAAVAEVRLYALGLAQARELSRRISRALTFLTDDCSSVFRPASSFRVRTANVKLLHKIINSMAKVLDQFTVTDNNYLLCNVFSRVLKVGLSGSEEALLEEFLATIFRSPHNPILAGSALVPETKKLLEVSNRLKLCSKDDILRGLKALWNCILDTDRRVILLTGPAASGKSTLISTCALAYSEYSNTPFNVHIMSGQVSQWNVYSVLCACCQPESKLEVSCLSRPVGAPKERFSQWDWVYIDSEDIKNDGLLSIARSEVHLEEEIRVILSPSLRVISELEDLTDASPSLISEASVIYSNDEDVPEEAAFQHEIEAKLPQYAQVLLGLYAKHYSSIMENTEDHLLKVSRKVCGQLLVNWLCLFLGANRKKQGLFLEFRLEIGLEDLQRPEQFSTSHVQVVWILSLIACIGRISRSRILFSESLLRICREEEGTFAAGILPFVASKRVASIFDLTYLFEEKTWAVWSEVCEPGLSPGHIPQLPTRSILFIDTDTTKRLKYRIRHALHTKTDFAIMGPHQCGKTLMLTQVLRELHSKELVSVLPLNILASTTCDGLEHQVETALEQFRPGHFGALGGVHHYAFIEDMNLASSAVYDDLRFYMEHGGWYNRGEFHRIYGLTLCLVHSYSAHKYRAANQRALRHFLLLFKYQYTDTELQGIFSELAVDPVLGQSLYSTYTKSRTDLVKTERTSHHCTLANYLKALVYYRAVGLQDLMLRKFFGDQQLMQVRDTFYVGERLLEVGREGYVELNEGNCTDLMARFEAVRTTCNTKYPEPLKFFKEPQVNRVDQKSRQLYHYCQVVDDLVHSQHSIVIVERELRTVRALTYMAAETLGYQVLSTSLADLSSELLNSMAEGQNNYLATDMKFQLKLMLDNAANKDTKTLCIVTLEEETNLKMPLLRNLLEFCSDLLLGKALKSLGPYSHYSKKDLYPEQIKHVLREKMQDNVILTILVRTDHYHFDRSLREGPLEHLKHHYRSLYNLCRLISYDRQPIPSVLKAHIQRFAPADAELMRDLAKVTPKPLEEFALEQVWYLAEAIKRFQEDALDASILSLEQGADKVIRCEAELDRSQYLTDLQTTVETLKAKQKELLALKFSLENLTLDDDLQMAALKDQMERERREMRGKTETCENKLMHELAKLPEKHGLSDLNEGNCLLLGALQSVLVPKSKPFPFGQPEKYPAHCKPVASKLASALQEVIVKLHNLEASKYPDISEFLRRFRDLGTASPLEELMGAMETLRSAVTQLSRKQAEWLEAPLRLQEQLRIRAECEQKAATEQLLVLSAQLNSVETRLKATEEQLLEMLQFRPKTVKIVGELKEMRAEWLEEISEFERRRSHVQGNSLLQAVFFVASLNSDYAGREKVRERLEAVLSSHNVLFDEENRAAWRGEEIPISPFLKDSVKACQLIWQLGLPYPIFLDPFGLAPDLLGADLPRLQYSVDLREERVLIDCITAGKGLLLLEPTEGMLQDLLPLLQLRYSNSIKTMRQGEEKVRKQFRLKMMPLDVHPDFRLYISLPSKPSLGLAQLCTVISLEPSDPASWKTSVLLQLSKIHAGQTAPASEEQKSEDLLALLLACEFPSIYAPAFQPIAKVVSIRLEASELSKRKQSSEESSESGQLQDTYLELLAIASDLSSVLASLKLAEWSVSPQMFRSLLLSACAEQITQQGFPSADQVNMFTGPILYRFVVRLLWILPVRQQNVVLLAYCLKRHCEEEVFARTMKAVSQGLALPFLRTSEALESRYNDLITHWFPMPDTLTFPDLQSFLHKDLHFEAILPEALDMRTQAVLYCWFRQDLVPLFIETLVVNVLGRRFSFLPDIDFVMTAEFITQKTPVSIFFKRTYPLPWLQRAAALNEIGLERILPIVSIKRRDIKGESRLERLLKELGASVKQRKWLVLEGLECLGKGEVERLTKHISSYLQRASTHEQFRLWLLFQGSPRDIPAWSGFITNTYRLCFRDPETVREHMMLAQEMFDSGTFDVVSSKKKQTYTEYSQVDLPTLRRMGKRTTRINPLLRGAVNKQLRGEQPRPSLLSSMTMTTFRRTSTRNNSSAFGSPSMPESENTEDRTGNWSDFYFYNLMLVICAFKLRITYCQDLPVVLSLKEVRTTIREVMHSNGVEMTANKVGGAGLVLLFLQIIGPSWDEMAFYAALNFMKHAVMSDSKALKFDFKDETGDWSGLQYPLYKMRGNSQKSIEALLFEMPKQDHLQLIGQPQVLASIRLHGEAAKMAPCFPSFSSDSATSLPAIQRLTNFQDAIKVLRRAAAPCDPSFDVESLRVRLTAQEKMRYSYFFLPDRYKSEDYSVLISVQPPTFKMILANLEKVNERSFDGFFRDIEEQMERILGFLTYKTAQISPKDQSVLSHISNDRTPRVWRKAGPYLLHAETQSSAYISQLSRPVACFPDLIDLSQALNPAGLLTALLRSLAFCMRVDIEFVEFEATEQQEYCGEFCFRLVGLRLFNACLRNQLLTDTYNSPPQELPTLCCTAAKKHKNLDIASLSVPAGILMTYKHLPAEYHLTDITKEERFTAMANAAFNYQRTDWLEAQVRETALKPVDRLNKVLCPLFPESSATRLWMVVGSDKPQGHWSKRGVKLDLCSP